MSDMKTFGQEMKISGLINDISEKFRDEVNLSDGQTKELLAGKFADAVNGFAGLFGGEEESVSTTSVEDDFTESPKEKVEAALHLRVAEAKEALMGDKYGHPMSESDANDTIIEKLEDFDVELSEEIKNNPDLKDGELDQKQLAEAHVTLPLGMSP